MKRIYPIFLFGALAVLLVAAACAPAEAGALNLLGPLAQGDLTSSPTATNMTLTPSTPGTGPEVILLDCPYCVDTIAHAQLLIPRDATIKVISPPELANNGEDDDDNGETRRRRAQLSGEAEVPGPGDPDGSGTARITLRPDQREVCFDLSVSNIEPATAAHIHEGAEGVAGPVVVPLDPAPTGGSSSGCVSDVDPALIRNILQNSNQYYVNVHNEEFPDGAIRGQLGRVDDDDNGDDDGNGDDDDNGDDDNGDGLGCRVIDRFRDKKLVLCRAEQNTTITLNVCQDETCREVQLTLQSCAPTTGTPSPTATQPATATTTLTAVPVTATATSTSTPIPPATATQTPISSPTATPTPITSPTSTPTAPATATNTSTPTSTTTGTPTP